MSAALPQSPEQFGAQLIKDKWGQDIDSHTALLVTLDYRYRGQFAAGRHRAGVGGKHPNPGAGVAGKLPDSRRRALRRSVFGLYTPPDVGPSIRIMEHVDEFADHGNGNHHTYEGIYRQTTPQVYGPATHLLLRPKWRSNSGCGSWICKPAIRHTLIAPGPPISESSRRSLTT